MPSRQGKLTAKMMEQLRQHERQYGKKHARDMKRFLRRNFSFKEAHKLALELNRNVSQKQKVSQIVNVKIGDTKKRRKPADKKKRVMHQHSISIAPSAPSQAYQQLGQLREQAVARDNQRRLNLLREQSLQSALRQANQNANPNQVRIQQPTMPRFNPLPSVSVANPENAVRGDTPEGVFRPIPIRPTPPPRIPTPQPRIPSARSSSSASSYFYDMMTENLTKTRPSSLGSMEAVDIQRIQDQQRSESERKAQTARQIRPMLLTAGEYSPVNVGSMPPIQNPELWRRLGLDDTIQAQIMSQIPQGQRNLARTFYNLPQRGGSREGSGRPSLTPLPMGRASPDDIFLGGAVPAGAGIRSQTNTPKTPSPPIASPPPLTRGQNAPMIPPLGLFGDDEDEEDELK